MNTKKNEKKTSGKSKAPKKLKKKELKKLKGGAKINSICTLPASDE